MNDVPCCWTQLLLTSMLRDAWKSDAIVQSDCCDSVNTMRGQVSLSLSLSLSLCLSVSVSLSL